MTKEQVKSLSNNTLNLKLAEWEGYSSVKEYHFHDADGIDGLPPDYKKYDGFPDEFYRKDIPEYSTNLNAIYKLEERLTEKEKNFYRHWFDSIVRDSIDPMNITKDNMEWARIHASPKQRAQALILALFHAHKYDDE
jgi:hypothetical protein